MIISSLVEAIRAWSLADFLAWQFIVVDIVSLHLSMYMPMASKAPLVLEPMSGIWLNAHESVDDKSTHISSISSRPEQS